MISHPKGAGWLLLMAALVFSGLSYLFAWRAGCLFDSQQGTGNFHSSSTWSVLAFASLAAAWLSLVVGVPLSSRPSVPSFLGSLLFFSVLAVPLGILMLMAAEASGVRACGP